MRYCLTSASPGISMFFSYRMKCAIQVWRNFDLRGNSAVHLTCGSAYQGYAEAQSFLRMTPSFQAPPVSCPPPLPQCFSLCCGTLPESTGVCGLTQMAVLLMPRGGSQLADCPRVIRRPCKAFPALAIMRTFHQRFSTNVWAGKEIFTVDEKPRHQKKNLRCVSQRINISERWNVVVYSIGNQEFTRILNVTQ